MPEPQRNGFAPGDVVAAEESNALRMSLHPTRSLDLRALARLEMNPDVLTHFLQDETPMDLRDGAWRGGLPSCGSRWRTRPDRPT